MATLEKKFLDKEGVVYLWQKIKGAFALKTELPKKLTDLQNDLPEASSTQHGLLAAADKKKLDSLSTDISEAVTGKADKATSLEGYGITDAYTKTAIDDKLTTKAEKAATLQGYGIGDAYTKNAVDEKLDAKANRATSLAGYGIADAYTKDDVDGKVGGKADKASTLAGYGITDAMTAEATKEAIRVAIGANHGVALKKVEQLPPSGEDNVIYLKPNAGSGNNIFDEYLWFENKFEKIGSTEVNLDGYVQKTDLVTIQNSEIDSIVNS